MSLDHGNGRQKLSIARRFLRSRLIPRFFFFFFLPNFTFLLFLPQKGFLWGGRAFFMSMKRYGFHILAGKYCRAEFLGFQCSNSCYRADYILSCCFCIHICFFFSIYFSFLLSAFCSVASTLLNTSFMGGLVHKGTGMWEYGEME